MAPSPGLADHSEDPTGSRLSGIDRAVSGNSGLLSHIKASIAWRPSVEAEAGVKPRSPKGRATARGLDARLRLQHPFMRAGDAFTSSKMTEPIKRLSRPKKTLTRITVSTATMRPVAGLRASGLQPCAHSITSSARRAIIVLSSHESDSPTNLPAAPHQSGTDRLY